MDWNDIDGDVVNVKGKDHLAEMDAHYARVFSTDSGQIILADLRNKTIEQPTWTPGEDASHGYAREGQNSVVRLIEERIKRARTR
jgi:hypothetical protein